MEVSPIGIFRSQLKTKLLLPRQGVLEKNKIGMITVDKKFAEGLCDLEGVERVWIIFHFHHNSAWKTKVLPPTSLKKRGVFATRSPYRPNFLGLSCCRIEKIEKNKIYVTGADLVDGTPVFDIKPYLPYADAFSRSKTGWIGEAEEMKYKIKWSPMARAQRNKIIKAGIPEVIDVILTQLAYHPTESSRKRVKKAGDDFEFAYRYLRVKFRLKENTREVLISELNFRGAADSEKPAESENAADRLLEQVLAKK